MASKGTIAVEIGHWYDPKERATKEDQNSWYEFVLNLEVGREIVRQLERHGFEVELNATSRNDLDTTGDWTMGKMHSAIKSSQMISGSLGGIKIGDGSSGFYKDISDKFQNGQIDLVAGIAVHFDGIAETGVQYDAKGFCAYTQTNHMESDSKKLCETIKENMDKEIKGISFHGGGIKSSVGYPWRGNIDRFPKPFAYCEFGFYDNPDDRKNFNDTGKRKALGTAAAKGILAYLGVDWIEEPNIYMFDKLPMPAAIPRMGEYEKIPNQSLIVVHQQTYHKSDYKGLFRINDGRLFWKGNVNSGRGLVHVVDNLNTFTSADFYPYFKRLLPWLDMPFLAFPMGKNYRGINGLHVINCGHLFYNANNNWKRVYAFEKMPLEREFASLPDKSLIVVHSKNNYSKERRVYDNLYVVQDGCLFYKDLSYEGREVDNNWFYNTTGAHWQCNGGKRERVVENPPSEPPIWLTPDWRLPFGQTNQTKGCDIQC